MFRLISTVLCTLVCLFSIHKDGSAQLLGGTAMIDITGPIGSTMYGYGARGNDLSTGIHDSLYARVLVLEDSLHTIALVSLDLGAFYAENVKRVHRALPADLNINEVLLVASHSHSTPTNRDDFPSEENPWIKNVENRIAEAIVLAHSNLRPVSIGAGFGEVHEGSNRRVVKANGEVHMMWRNEERLPTWPLDYQLGVIGIKDESGPLAVLYNFACHPVILGPDNLEYSADYPGAVARYVKEALGGQIMFLPGAQGDINPFEDKQPIEEGAFDQVERMGKVVADEVERVYKNIHNWDNEAEIFVKSETIPLSERKDINRDSISFHASISSVIIGNDIGLGFFPGEFFVKHGIYFKEKSPIKNTFFVGYTNDALSYFPTIQSTTEGGYGASWRTQVEVGAGERLVNRALINLLYISGKISP